MVGFQSHYPLILGLIEPVISSILPVKISIFHRKISNWSAVSVLILFDQFSTQKEKKKEKKERGKKAAQQEGACGMLCMCSTCGREQGVC